MSIISPSLHLIATISKIAILEIHGRDIVSKPYTAQTAMYMTSLS